MGEPFLAEIRILSFGYAPRGWAFCDGQTLAIGQNQALFALLGTTYGGNGETTFRLPDFRARVPIGVAGTHPLGEAGGAAFATGVGVPVHSHTVAAASTTSEATSGPSGAFIDLSKNNVGAADVGTQVQIGTTSFGGKLEEPHENRQPYLGLSFAIALEGIFPSQS